MALKPPKLPPIESSGVGSFQDHLNSPNKTSTSYKLSGDSTKHVLPTHDSLQPNQDTKPGEIETWPAYASRAVSDTSKITRSFNKDLSAVKKTILPKPKFLAALEAYVRKEVVQLGCTESGPSELRLQAYREVFEYLIEDFKTYKPLLSQGEVVPKVTTSASLVQGIEFTHDMRIPLPGIKSEYEKMLSHYRQKIHDLEPLKAMLVTVSEQCDQEILRIREEERQEITSLRNNKMELLKYIDKMKEKEKSLKSQVLKLQEELSIEYRKYRNECDMRKLLISDMNDLRHQQEDLKRAAGQGVIDADDDPIRLKLSLKVAKEDLTRQSEQLTRMQADYGDVVPRRDFEMLEAKFAELNEKNDLLTSDFVQLKEEHDTLLDVHKQVLEQRDQFYTEAETLRRSATPRPEWSKCGDVIPAGPGHWEEVSSGKDSQEILETLLTELKARAPEGPAVLEGKGIEEDVPKFLRYAGPIRNRQLKKSDVANLLQEIWAQKVSSDADRGSREGMSDFLHAFFMKKFNDFEELAAEWGYSLWDALNNFSDEPHIKIVLEIINGEATEDLYYRQMDIIKSFMVELEKLDPQKTERVTQAQFSSALTTSFPLKTEASATALLEAALEELEYSPDKLAPMEYQALFTEDEEGHTGPFLNLLRAQEAEECETYLTDIINQLEATELISVNDLRSTLMMIDPAIDQPLTMKYLELAFKCCTQELDEAEPVEKELVLQRLRKGGCHRAGAVY